MSEGHIPFFELEEEDSIDRAHLDRCEECRKNEQIFRFLRFQARTVPWIDAPPFFAAGVANRMERKTPVFAFLLERAARRLIPVFVSLILLTSVLLFRLQPESADLRSEVLFEPSPPEQISMEYVVNSLQQPLEEGGSFEEP